MKRGVISPLGEIIAHDVSFEPIVNVYDLRVEGGTERLGGVAAVLSRASESP